MPHRRLRANGITIKEPKDFVGKKVGAPGLGAFLHVLFVKWLVEKGIDPKTGNFRRGGRFRPWPTSSSRAASTWC